jgi:hypothetical protein
VGNDPVGAVDPFGLRLKESISMVTRFSGDMPMGGGTPAKSNNVSAEATTADGGVVGEGAGGSVAGDRTKGGSSTAVKNLVKRLAMLLTAAKKLEELNNENNTFYRGLSGEDVVNLNTHHAILPKNPDGNVTPEKHALGSEGSQFVSLTVDRGMAEWFASNGPDPSHLVVVIDGQRLQKAGVLVFHNVSNYSPEARTNVQIEGEVLATKVPIWTITGAYPVK